MAICSNYISEDHIISEKCQYEAQTKVYDVMGHGDLSNDKIRGKRSHSPLPDVMCSLHSEVVLILTRVSAYFFSITNRNFSVKKKSL